MRSLYTTLITFLITILWKGHFTIPQTHMLVKLMLDSTICSFGLFFYIKSVNTLNFSNVGSLSIIGIVIQQAYYYFIKNNPIHHLDILACFLMSLGSIIQLFNLKLQKGVFYVFCSCFFWTIGYISLSETLQKIEYYWSVPFMELTVLLISGIATLINRKNDEPLFKKYKRNIGSFILLAILLYISSLFNNYSFKYNSLNTLSFLQLSMMPIVFIISFKIFREKLKLVELIAFLASIIGFALFVLK